MIQSIVLGNLRVIPKTMLEQFRDNLKIIQLTIDFRHPLLGNR